MEQNMEEAKEKVYVGLISASLILSYFLIDTTKTKRKLTKKKKEEE